MIYNTAAARGRKDPDHTTNNASKYSHLGRAQARTHGRSRCARPLSRVLWSCLLGQDVKGGLAHLVADKRDLRLVRRRDVVPARVGGVVLAVGGQALGDADARAVELADDPLLVLGVGADRRGVDEVAGPPQRDRLVAEAERWHHLGQVLGEEVL